MSRKKRNACYIGINLNMKLNITNSKLLTCSGDNSVVLNTNFDVCIKILLPV